jgi:uncharacterized lipoprotein YmbA
MSILSNLFLSMFIRFRRALVVPQPRISTSKSPALFSSRSGLPASCLRLGFLCLALTGCHLFQPDTTTARHFILAPVPAAASPAPAGPPLAVGVGQIKLPGYLFESTLAVRQGTNEITYLPLALWAERLDVGIQRTLAADLAAQLPTDQIRLTAWQPSDVSAGVYVTIDQFDIDAHGHGALTAWWRIVSPDDRQLLRAGQCRLTRDGPPPGVDPQGAVATLSQLLSELTGQLAPALRAVAAPLPPKMF